MNERDDSFLPDGLTNHPAQEPAGLVHFKVLKLIPPETANQLGIPAEAPVFVSPFIRGAETCRDCGTTFTPLVYQTGYEVTAQHFHERSGGIYFYSTLSPAVVAARGMDNPYAWMGLVEPHGLIDPPYDERWLADWREEAPDLVMESRAEQVYVHEIRAYHRGRPEAITEGVLIANCLTDKSHGLRRLSPECGSALSVGQPVFRFIVDQGEVLFEALQHPPQFQGFSLPPAH